MARKPQKGDNGEIHFRFLLLGNSGSGKSSTGNTIIGLRMFREHLNFDSVTSELELRCVNRADALIEIMDTPGLDPGRKTQEEIATIIVQAMAYMHHGLDAVLYVVKLGRYKEEEYGVYQRMKALFDNITSYIIVIFTGGDMLAKTRQTFTDLIQTMPQNLCKVLTECGNKSLVFNNYASNPAPQVEELLDIARGLKRQNNGPYLCPKYAWLPERLEEEVARRLAVLEKEKPKRQISGNGEMHFRFLLLGKVGSGKSSTGNTILGEQKFCRSSSFASVTSECELQRGNRAGALIELQRAPRVWDRLRPWRITKPPERLSHHLMTRGQCRLASRLEHRALKASSSKKRVVCKIKLRNCVV